MNYRMLHHLLSWILAIEAALLLLPLLVAGIYGESALPFLYTIGILLVLAVPGILLKPKNNRIYAKEGFVTVAGAWVLMSLAGALPFIFSGAIPGFFDAFFETVSGFTTTGSTILTEIQSLPRSILFWRSETHWIGGMGVLMFMLAILPSGGGNAIHLLRAEVPGPTKGKIVPKLKQTAAILYGIYMGLTLLEAIALLCTGMPLYDSIVNAMATAGTGGFAVLNDSIGGYGNTAAEWIIAVFMMLFGINFNIYFFVLVRRFKDILHNEELRVYLGLVALATAAIVIADGVAVRTAFFQVTSIISTTGFGTADFMQWSGFSQTVLVFLMLVGACAGSTAGGLKLSRVMILVKSAVKEIKHMLRPNSVNVPRMDGEPIQTETLHSATNYLTMYFWLLAGSTLLLSLNGFDFTTNITAVITCINNIGPGLGAVVGPTGNFASFGWAAKLLLSVDMLLGRLEILPVLILLAPQTYKKN